MDKSSLRPNDYVYMAVNFRPTIWLYKIRLDRQLENGNWIGCYHWGHSTVVKQDEISHIVATRHSPNILKDAFGKDK